MKRPIFLYIFSRENRSKPATHRNWGPKLGLFAKHGQTARRQSNSLNIVQVWCRGGLFNDFYCLFSLFFGIGGDWAQGLRYTRQVFYHWATSTALFLFFWFWNKVYYAVQAGFEFLWNPDWALNLQRPSCLSLLCSGIIGVCHYTWPQFLLFMSNVFFKCLYLFVIL